MLTDSEFELRVGHSTAEKLRLLQPLAVTFDKPEFYFAAGAASTQPTIKLWKWLSLGQACLLVLPLVGFGYYFARAEPAPTGPHLHQKAKAPRPQAAANQTIPITSPDDGNDCGAAGLPTHSGPLPVLGFTPPPNEYTPHPSEVAHYLQILREVSLVGLSALTSHGPTYVPNAVPNPPPGDERNAPSVSPPIYTAPNPKRN